jgi:hypothetical protein
MSVIYNAVTGHATLEDAQRAIAFVAGLLAPLVVIAVAYLGRHLYLRHKELAKPY